MEIKLEMDKPYPKAYNMSSTEYSSRSYIEMPKNGEIQYISTIVGVRGNPVFTGNEWVPKADKNVYTTVKVDKDDLKAKRHYVKTLYKDGREIKIWECGLCGKEFRFQYTLVRHIPTHTDVRNYQCDVCPKAFRQLSTLAQHKATHLNMRPFVCTYCHKSFNRISTLISHKKIHYDAKRHICPFCNKGFHQKGNLRNHMYTHTNERPYKCEICNKGFNQKSNLVCHKASTHSNKTIYDCDMCAAKFIKQSMYMTHMETAHNIIVKFKKVKETEKKAKNPKCTLVDELNNVIYHLPISQDSSEPEIDKNIPQLNGQNNENEILTIIKHAPTEAMYQLNEIGKASFVLLYQCGDAQPKICMAVIKTGEYALVNPSKTVISNYHIENATNMLSHTFPIVSTVVQKLDSNGKLKTMVMPAGLGPEVVESFEGANGVNVYDYYSSATGSTRPSTSTFNKQDEERVQKNKTKRTTFVYTKTQPGQRQKTEIILENIPNKIEPQVVSPENHILADIVDTVEPYKDSENPIELLYLVGEPEKCNKIETDSIADLWSNVENPVVCEALPKLEETVEEFPYTNIDENFIKSVFDSGDICAQPTSVDIPSEIITTANPPAQEAIEKHSLANIDTSLLTPMEIMREPYSNYIDFDTFDETTFNDNCFEIDNNHSQPYHLPDLNGGSTLNDNDLFIKLEQDDVYNFNS